MKILKGKKYSILSFVSKYSFIAVILFSLLLPVVFIGAANTPSSTATPGPGVNIDAKIQNPLGGGMDTVPKFIEAVINIVLIVGIPLLVLAIIYAGFLFVKAQGNSGELEIAKRTLLYTVIGGALLLGAFVIASAIGKTVDEIKRTS
jgi:hypothetical protein